MTFNNYTREIFLKNRLKFQSQEHVEDLGLNWDSFKWRNHQPDIGRFFNVDPLSEKYIYNSPYAFSENKVVGHVELEGLESAPSAAFDMELLKFSKSVAPNVPTNVEIKTNKAQGDSGWDTFRNVLNKMGDLLGDWGPDHGGGFVVTGPNSPGTTGPTVSSPENRTV